MTNVIRGLSAHIFKKSVRTFSTIGDFINELVGKAREILTYRCQQPGELS